MAFLKEHYGQFSLLNPSKSLQQFNILVNTDAAPYIKNKEGKPALDGAQCFDTRQSPKMAMDYTSLSSR